MIDIKNKVGLNTDSCRIPFTNSIEDDNSPLLLINVYMTIKESKITHSPISQVCGLKFNFH